MLSDEIEQAQIVKSETANFGLLLNAEKRPLIKFNELSLKQEIVQTSRLTALVF